MTLFVLQLFLAGTNLWCVFHLSSYLGATYGEKCEFDAVSSIWQLVWAKATLMHCRPANFRTGDLFWAKRTAIGSSIHFSMMR